jgi:hypothetical protein
VVKATPWPLYPQDWPGTHCLGVWVGPRAGVDGCRRFGPTGFRPLDIPAHNEPLHWSHYPSPHFQRRAYEFVFGLQVLSKEVNVQKNSIFKSICSPHKAETNLDWVWCKGVRVHNLEHMRLKKVSEKIRPWFFWAIDTASLGDWCLMVGEHYTILQHQASITPWHDATAKKSKASLHHCKSLKSQKLKEIQEFKT